MEVVRTAAVPSIEGSAAEAEASGSATVVVEGQTVAVGFGTVETDFHQCRNSLKQSMA